MFTGIALTRMSSGDAVTVNERIQTAVTDSEEEMGEAAVGAPVTEAARDLNEATRPLSPGDPLSYGGRRRVDRAADRCLGGIHDICHAKIGTFEQEVVPLTEPQELELESAGEVITRLFPAGKGFLKGRWSEQYGVTEMILEEALKPDIRPHLDRLGLTESLDLLTKIHTVYGERMGFTVVQPREAEMPLAIWHDALETYLAAVIYSQKKNPALKERLTEPYETMAKAIREARRRRSQSESTADTQPEV